MHAVTAPGLIYHAARLRVVYWGKGYEGGAHYHAGEGYVSTTNGISKQTSFETLRRLAGVDRHKYQLANV